MNNVFQKFVRSEIAFTVFALTAISNSYAANFSVTQNEESGVGSLHEVIQSANAIEGSHTIKLWSNNLTPSYSQDLPPIRKDITLVTPDKIEFGINKPITGSASVTKSGKGVLSLEGVNNFSGKLLVQEGILQLKSANAYSGSTYVENAQIELYHNSSLSTSKVFLNDLGVLSAKNHLSIQNAVELSGNNTYFNTNEYSVALQNELSGSSHFAKLGDGTLALNGANSFSGSLSVEKGTLVLGNANNQLRLIQVNNGKLIVGHEAGLGSSSIDVGAGTLAFNTNGNFHNKINVSHSSSAIDSSSESVALSNAIYGPGTLNKTGEGVLTLNEVNTHKGGTIIQQGTLRINADDNLGYHGATITIGNGTLQTTSNVHLHHHRQLALSSENSTIDTLDHDITIQNHIVGSGGLNKKGKGKLVIESDNNSFELETTVQDGTLIAKKIGSIGKKGVVLTEGTLAFTDSTTLNPSHKFHVNGEKASLDTGKGYVTVDTVMTGNGSFHKYGSGVLKLNAANSFQGTVNAHQGTLVVNGQTDNVFVHSSAVLMGSGRVNALNNYGIVAPGNSIGTLYIAGDYDQGSSGVLEIEINNQGACDLLEVSGVASLDGKLTILPEHGMYSSGTTYTFINAAGGISGEFNTLIAPAQVEGTVLYDTNTVKYRIDKFTSLADLASKTDSDTLAAALAMDQILAPAGSDMDYVIKELLKVLNDSGLGDNFQEALAQLQPGHYSAIGFAQQYNVVLLRSNLFNRIQEFVSFPCADKWDNNKTWDFWFNAAGDFNKQYHLDDFKGYTANSVAGVLGLDKQVSRRWRVGFAGSYIHSNVKWEDGLGKGLVNSFYGMMYGLYKLGRWYLESSFYGGYNHYHATRHIKFGDIDRNATHENNGHTLAGELGFGYVLPFKNWQIQPFLNTDYILTYQNDFTEKGAQSLDLVVNNKYFAMLRGEVGFNFSKCFRLQIGAISPDIKLSYICERQLKTPAYTVHYKDESTEYNVSGMNPFRNLFSPGVGFKSSLINDTLTFSAYYEAEVGYKFWDQRVNARLSYDW